MKRLSLVFLALYLFQTPLFAEEQPAANPDNPLMRAEDTDKDGKIDRWTKFDGNGHVMGALMDTNKDGKPDRILEYFKGATWSMWELDRNFDGNVDLRELDHWENGRYVMFWRQDDSNFDGLIDAYYEQDSPKPESNLIGSPINSATARKNGAANEK